MAERLTDKQRAFVECYLANGFNATQAAIQAGYSAKTARVTGPENLSKPAIQATINQRFAQMAMSADEALYRLSEQARGSMADFLDVENGNIDLTKAAEAGKLHLLKKVSVDRAANKIAIELYDAQGALVQILREQHLLKGEPTDRDEVVVLTDEQRAERIAALLESARARRAGRAAADGQPDE